jgi:hypothetical protein
MGNGGWIYFRVVEGRGYCFGKTDSPSRRDSEYRKENPWIEKIYDFFVEDMHAVEEELIERTKDLRLLENSREWLRLCDEAKEIMDGIRKKYALMTHSEWERIQSEKQEPIQSKKHIDTPKGVCPGCRRPMSYEGPGYRCHKCGIQTM